MQAKKSNQINSPSIRLAPQDRYREERQVLLRLYYCFHTKVGLCPEVVLTCRQSGLQAKMVYSEYIAKYPKTSRLLSNQEFLLFFEPLPKDCKSFDFQEICEESNAFSVQNILRNNKDVYKVRLG